MSLSMLLPMIDVASLFLNVTVDISFFHTVYTYVMI